MPDLVNAMSNPKQASAISQCANTLSADTKLNRFLGRDDAKIVFGNTPNLLIRTHNSQNGIIFASSLSIVKDNRYLLTSATVVWLRAESAYRPSVLTCARTDYVKEQTPLAKSATIPMSVGRSCHQVNGPDALLTCARRRFRRLVSSAARFRSPSCSPCFISPQKASISSNIASILPRL